MTLFRLQIIQSRFCIFKLIFIINWISSFAFNSISFVFISWPVKPRFKILYILNNWVSSKEFFVKILGKSDFWRHISEICSFVLLNIEWAFSMKLKNSIFSFLYSIQIRFVFYALIVSHVKHHPQLEIWKFYNLFRFRRNLCQIVKNCGQKPKFLINRVKLI